MPLVLDYRKLFGRLAFDYYFCIQAEANRNMNEERQDNRQWYAIRVTYNREMKVKDELDAIGVENFIPMQYRYFEKNGKRHRRLVPSVHNLIFIRMSQEEMAEYKTTTRLPIRYMMDREKNIPITVSETEMHNFIIASGSLDEGLIYLDSEAVALHKGDRVRITGGIFNGLEGSFMRIKGDRRVVVCIPGIIAVATAYIHQSLIEKIG